MTDQPWQGVLMFVMALLSFFTALIVLMYILFGRQRDRHTPRG